MVILSTLVCRSNCLLSPMPNPKALMAKLTSGNDFLAESSVDDIAALGESALPALSDLLDSSDPNSRWWALRALCLIPHPEVLTRLRSALRDPDPDLRQCAALGLAQQPHSDSVPDLIAALADPDRLTARLAADALIVVGKPAVPALITVLESTTSSAQIEAARALAAIGDARAIPTMFTAWEDGSALVQHWIEQGFEKMGVGMQFFTPDG